ncbi:MAG TPA: response regulator transcription factor [Frankiaceae bacterium]|nr:response regulator transcription factor [Frankiaceae bacterium]
MIRVGIADDQPLVRAGLVTMVGAAPDLVAVGEASNGAEAVELARRDAPDVLLMDVRMPVLDGIEATARIAREAPAVKVLMLTTFDLDEYVYAALRAGASGFLLKDVAPEDLFAAVRVVAAGDALLAPAVTRKLVDEFARRPAGARFDPAALAPLTEREREVLALVGRGLTNDEIGRELYLSPATAKTHVGRILAKLGARDRVQLVVTAYETGLVRPGE